MASLGERISAKDLRVIDREVEEEDDLKKYLHFQEMKLVNLVTTMMKNPDKRIGKEIEFMILYLKINFDMFRDVDKQDIKLMSRRLALMTLKPGEILIHEGDQMENLYFVIEGCAFGFQNWDP